MTKIKAFFELTKPRALAVIIFTTCLGYLIAEPERPNWVILAYLALGTAVSAAGSLALNQHLERRKDALMKRTQSRPLPSGRVTPREALVFGWSLMVLGYVWLWLAVNPICSLATIACGLSYLYIYTPLKYTTSLSSFAGAIPGALLPVMGWLASRGRMELGAWVLFVILFLWQIPHALIIAIRYRDDYERAGMRQLPVITSEFAANRQILVHVLILIAATMMPAVFDIAQGVYTLAALLLGGWIAYSALQYVIHENDLQARRFFVSLSAYLPLLLLAMYADKWSFGQVPWT